MLALWTALLAVVGMAVIAVTYLLRRISDCEARLALFDGLLRHARLETQVAHGLAQTTNRLIVSITNGEEARRNVQGETPSEGAPAPGVVDRDLLAQRMRYRQATESLSVAVGNIMDKGIDLP